jgi:hypothetical protein
MMEDRRTEKVLQLLRKHMGQTVILHLSKGGGDSIQQGVIEREDEPLGTFVLRIDRMAREHPETHELIVLPQSETEFFPEDVFYVQRPLESEEEAKQVLATQGDGPKIIPGSSGMVGGGYGGLQ